MKQKDTIKKIKKFVLDKPQDKEDYENLLNNHKVYIIKESFAYDRKGQALVTVWYEIELED